MSDNESPANCTPSNMADKAEEIVNYTPDIERIRNETTSTSATSRQPNKPPPSAPACQSAMPTTNLSLPAVSQNTATSDQQQSPFITPTTIANNYNSNAHPAHCNQYQAATQQLQRPQLNQSLLEYMNPNPNQAQTNQPLLNIYLQQQPIQLQQPHVSSPQLVHQPYQSQQQQLQLPSPQNHQQQHQHYSSPQNQQQHQHFSSSQRHGLHRHRRQQHPTQQVTNLPFGSMSQQSPMPTLIPITPRFSTVQQSYVSCLGIPQLNNQQFEPIVRPVVNSRPHSMPTNIINNSSLPNSQSVCDRNRCYNNNCPNANLAQQINVVQRPSGQPSDQVMQQIDSLNNQQVSTQQMAQPRQMPQQSFSNPVVNQQVPIDNSKRVASNQNDSRPTMPLNQRQIPIVPQLLYRLPNNNFRWSRAASLPNFIRMPNVFRNSEPRAMAMNMNSTTPPVTTIQHSRNNADSDSHPSNRRTCLETILSTKDQAANIDTPQTHTQNQGPILPIQAQTQIYAGGLIQPGQNQNLIQPNNIQTQPPIHVPASVSSTTATTTLPEKKNIEMQTEPIISSHKACQVRIQSAKAQLVNRKVSVKPATKDEFTQTNSRQLDSNSEPEMDQYQTLKMVDRGCSPIKFPPEPIPVRRKETAKRKHIDRRKQDDDDVI